MLAKVTNGLLFCCTMYVYAHRLYCCLVWSDFLEFVHLCPYGCYKRSFTEIPTTLAAEFCVLTFGNYAYAVLSPGLPCCLSTFSISVIVSRMFLLLQLLAAHHF